MTWWHTYLLAGLALAVAYLANEVRRDLMDGPSLRHGLRCTCKSTYIDVLGLAVPVVNLAVIAVWLLLRGGQGWYRLRHRLAMAGLL